MPKREKTRNKIQKDQDAIHLILASAITSFCIVVWSPTRYVLLVQFKFICDTAHLAHLIKIANLSFSHYN